MNVIVNPKDAVVFHTNVHAPRGFIVIETQAGFHYISNEQIFFMPREHAEELLKKDEVRRLFGTE